MGVFGDESAKFLFASFSDFLFKAGLSLIPLRRTNRQYGQLGLILFRK